MRATPNSPETRAQKQSDSDVNAGENNAGSVGGDGDVSGDAKGADTVSAAGANDPTIGDAPTGDDTAGEHADASGGGDGLSTADGEENSPAPQDDEVPPERRKREHRQQIRDEERARGNKTMTVILILVLLIILLLIFYGLYRRTHRAETPVGANYEFVVLAANDAANFITATGNLKPLTEVTVGSEISGIIKSVSVDSNDNVRKGQELALIDPTRFEQEVASSRAQLESAKTRLDAAQATVRETTLILEKRSREYATSGGRTPAQSVMEEVNKNKITAAAELRRAEEDVKRLTALLDIQEVNLAKTVIRAPIDGVVLKRAVEPGQTVAASFNVPDMFVLAADMRKMKLVANVSEADISRVEVGAPASFTVDAWPEMNFDAKVLKVESAGTVTNNLVTYAAELEVNNDQLKLRDGMSAVSRIRAAGGSSTGALRVPLDALTFRPKGAARNTAASGTAGAEAELGKKPAEGDAVTVWVLRDGRAVPVPARVGKVGTRRAEISGEGITDGVRVIVRER
ncbi:MAG: efflux RND transporter periplasmic adaptor subunit [Puniceicoccales bacterium]|nr:efflux RND transporter periplasmic adaptor subunit [Puniceicoccales bacterium]